MCYADNTELVKSLSSLAYYYSYSSATEEFSTRLAHWNI